MEELAIELELAGPAVDGISGDRQVDRGEVDADLVGPARLEPDVEQRVARQELTHIEVGDRIARRVGVERMPQGVAPVAADRRFDPAAARPWSPDDERDVMTIELMAAHELLQPAVRLLRARDDHQPRRVAVEPVHDAGPVGISAGDVVLEQPVDERPGCMPGCRVNDEPGRLVDDDEISSS